MPFQKSAAWRWAMRLVVFSVVFLILSQDLWQPYVDDWQCRYLSARLSEHYGLVVRYEDPAQFAIAPVQPMETDPDIGSLIEPANRHSVRIALQAIEVALAKYPPELIHQYLKAVFIPGNLKLHNVEVSGTLFRSWIFVSAKPAWDDLGPQGYEQTLHHELSSIFKASTPFAESEWCAANTPDFNYLPTQMEVIRAAALESRQDPANEPEWHVAGFVDDYGMSSLENDFNTYAELAMTEPEKLRQLADQYPRIRAKTRILVDFYSHLAPELQQYFERAGLTDRGAAAP